MREVQKEKGNIEKKETNYLGRRMKSASEIRAMSDDVSKKNGHDSTTYSTKELRTTDELRGETKKPGNINKLEENIQKYDPHAKEIDQRANEGWERPRGTDRSEFGRQYGVYEHDRWKDEVCEAEEKAGRKRGIDFDLMKGFKHPDGRTEFPDYVNYKTDVIIDRKPADLGDNRKELIDKYEDQRKRHIEAYEYTTGHKVLYYGYSPYPSTKELWSEDQNKK